MVRHFMAKFGEPCLDAPGRPDPAVLFKFRRKLIEELAELLWALDRSDYVEVVDALSDIRYALHGIELLCGVQAVSDAAFEEVHRTNMQKVVGEGGAVVKPDGWMPPDLRRVLSERFPEQHPMFH
jgi:hypothetical protein